MNRAYRILLILSLIGGLPWLATAAGMQPQTSQQPAARTETAIFAGGCFWCMEKPFEQLPGVISVTSGYTGGHTANPSYQTYAAGGHVEAIEVVYEPAKISYRQLLDTFWHQINPTDAGGQFVDRGPQYTTAIFVFNDEQRREAEASKRAMEQSGVFGAPIVTPIRTAGPFWPAEEYHQDFYKKNPLRYWYYRSRSGRDDYLERIWGAAAKH